MIIRNDFQIRNTFKINALAKNYYMPESVEDVIKLKNIENMHILGCGSNLLIKNDLQNVMSLEKLEVGKSIHELINDNLKRNLGGLEVLAGIPCSLAGAIKNNAGGKYGFISNLVKSVTVIEDGKEKTFMPNFAYRDSGISGCIVDAQLGLINKSKSEIINTYKMILGEKKKNQPLNKKSAGCIFKNPGVVTASYLIESCGLKGYKIGSAHISYKHANFIECTENANPDDILNLIDVMRGVVQSRHRVELNLEIEIWS